MPQIGQTRAIGRSALSAFSPMARNGTRLRRGSPTSPATAPARRNCPVVEGGRITAHPRWSRVRRKWVQPEASQNPPDAEGEAADTFHRPQAIDGRLTRKEMILGHRRGGGIPRSTPLARPLSYGDRAS